jgi:hypothetical protein
MQENSNNPSQPSPLPNFIIVAPSYNELSGGVIVLHKLCDLINELGYSAKIWDYYHYPLIKSLHGSGFRYTSQHVIKNLTRPIRGKKKRNFKLGTEKHERTTHAGLQDLRDNTIVIYPEVVYGNPLDAKNVVHWWLYKRKFPPRKKQAKVSELNFHYHESYLDELLVSEGTSLFTLTSVMADKYKQSNFGVRRGYCHIVRKGRSRVLDQHPRDSILIDGLTHEEMARVFNDVEYCVSYDSYTMLTRFAALCGCKVMIVPEEGVTLEAWEPDERLRYGLAYGQENIAWAENTKHLILGELQKIQDRNIEMTRKFLDNCLSHFSA